MHFTYHLTRKNVKNINIRIKEDGGLYVSAPPYASISDIETCLLKRQDWINASQSKMREKQHLEPPEDLCLVRKRFEAALREVWQTLENESIPYPALRLRAMKTRWGSCAPMKGWICLNTALYALDDDLLHYVILHELLHFLHCNHGPDFWAAIGRSMPDWKVRRRALSHYKL